ncbi:MAG: hypothetical protein LBG70_04945, partial [Bifidobacteriaceae bacterium]|nr:hypothetical protein [Bifidobacteriaceae bacterium]
MTQPPKFPTNQPPPPQPPPPSDAQPFAHATAYTGEQPPPAHNPTDPVAAQTAGLADQTPASQPAADTALPMRPVDQVFAIQPDVVTKPAARPRRRAAIALAAVATVALGFSAVKLFVLDAFASGAANPSAAVNQMIDNLTEQDWLNTVRMVSPA